MTAFKDRNVDPTAAFLRHRFAVALQTIGVSLTKRAFYIRKFAKAARIDYASVFASSVTATLTLVGWITSGDELLSQITLAVDAVPEKYKTTTVGRLLHNGAWIEKAVVTAQVFSAAYTVNVAAVGQKWGAIIVYFAVADGTYSTGTITADQAYASEANAIAAAATKAIPAGKVVAGLITVQSKNNLAWTATTDDMTAASDLAAVNFYATGANAAAGSYNDVAFSMVPVALTEVIEDVYTKRVIRENQFLVLAFTTDGAGAAVNANLSLTTRGWPLRGDAPLEA